MKYLALAVIITPLLFALGVIVGKAIKHGGSTADRPDEFVPTRLCCGQRHFGLVCPDGKVMCCMCFNRFEKSELFVDEQGLRVDVCVPCGTIDAQQQQQQQQ